MTVKPGQLVELDIERLASGGAGVGRFDGFVVFVPLAAPQDRVKVRIESVKKTFATAELLEILNAGPNRRVAPCEYFGECGGCNWQHVEYHEQLRQKQAIVERLARKLNPATIVEAIIPSPLEWRYRNRVQVHQLGSTVGFNRRSSSEIIDVKDCLIADQKIGQHFQSLRQKPSSQRKKFEIAINQSGEVQDLDLDFDSYQFTQVNQAQNQNLVAYVLASAQERPHIFDLYCGSGNFTYPLAHRFVSSQVTGVEENKSSITEAQKKMSAQTNLNFLSQKTSSFLKQAKHLTGSLVVLDPPRAGCEEGVIDALCKAPPAQIIYVSCDPQTAARDWGLLSQRFRLTHVRAFDMFPQTDHVEVVSVLADHARLD